MAKGRKFPFILVAPQCPEGTWWDPEVLSKMLTQIERTHRVDKDRIYLTGLSMGGFGTWNWAALEPNRFAAIAPICGGGNSEDAPKIAHLPTWVTHGDKDGAVPISESIAMVDAVKKAGATDVRFDIIKGGEHDVWTPVYEGTMLYDWFLTKTRRK